MLLRRQTLRQFSALVAFLVVAWPAMADDDEHDDGRERNHHRPDQLREAVERGDIKPLTDILRIVQPNLPGQIVGVEAEYKAGGWIYEFRVLDVKGQIFEAHVDAATANIIKIEEK
jgi:uncharacterized membrane protein YkoI